MKRSDKIYGMSTTFSDPDKIIKAAREVSEKGFTKFDVNTPYPVHGMDKAMKMKPSKLGYITLIFGLSGAAFALLFMFWAMTVDYPMVIGGKPFFALPAFIPITFEVTVLLATLSTVIGMITFFFNFPFNSHPLHETEYMRLVSLDKFGIIILSDDPKFDVTNIKTLFNELGGESIQEIYYPVEERFPMFQPKFIMFLVVIAATASGITYLSLNKLLFMPPFDFMMEQEKLIPQEGSDIFKNSIGMRTPVEGTVARGYLPYPYKDVPVPAEVLTNPLIPSVEVIETGRKKFNIFCSPCHGHYGDGDSRLRGQFPNPPSLHSDRLRNMEDGMVYHIITNGQNIMPSYASQVPRNERWAIVHYIRALQRAKNATLADIEALKKERSNDK